MLTADILEALNGLTESPWGDLHGRPLDARNLSRRLQRYGVKPGTVRLGSVTAKGYKREDLSDTWSRYVSVCEDGVELNTDAEFDAKPQNGVLPADSRPLPLACVTPSQTGHSLPDVGADKLTSPAEMIRHGSDPV